MAVIISLLTTLISLVLAVQVGRQYWLRRRSYQLLWTVSLLLFATGTGCQLVAELVGWSPLVYRLWYLTGAILTAAFLGQGTVYLQARRSVAHVVMAVLVLASVWAAVAVWRAPVNLSQALASPSISGQGMSSSVRLLTPFFNIFGTVTLVGGAARSVWSFLWNGGGSRRAWGTGLIAVGTLVVATGGTLARFSLPQALYVSELIGIMTIFSGFTLTTLPSPVVSLAPVDLAARRHRVTSLGVSLGATILLSAVISLPVLPWLMGIVTDVKHVYTSQVPEENRGAYLVTNQGVMQLYSWRVNPDHFPSDAPTLDAASIRSLTVVQKQFDPPEKYQLYNLSTSERIPWHTIRTADRHLTLIPGPLAPGEYFLIIPTDGMFGGQTQHFFRLR